MFSSEQKPYLVIKILKQMIGTTSPDFLRLAHNPPCCSAQLLNYSMRRQSTRPDLERQGDGLSTHNPSYHIHNHPVKTYSQVFSNLVQ
jgi:hypothetical protein